VSIRYKETKDIHGFIAITLTTKNTPYLTKVEMLALGDRKPFISPCQTK
jgi:hypothetical protein